MAAPKHVQIAGLCLLGIFFVGIGCLFVLSQLDSILPSLLLDTVLTPEELRDEEVRDRTLDLMKRLSSGHAVYWYATGAALVVLSGVGLWSIFREVKRQEAS